MNDADIYLMIKNKHTDYFCAIQSLKLAFQLWYLSLENITNNTKKKQQYFVFNHIILIFNNSSKGNLIKI